MGLTGLTPWPRPPAAAMATHDLAPTATPPTPTAIRHPAPPASHHPALTATPDRTNGQPPRTVVIMTSGAYAAAKS